MDRGRGRARATKKRTALTSHAQQTEPTSPSTPPVSSTTTTAPPHRAPHTASQRGGKSKSTFPSQHRQSSPSTDQAFRVTPRTDRPARSTTFPTSSSFTFESPSSLSGSNMAAGPSSARKRARTFEISHDSTADDEAISKGGHSLRKRARIDYTQEQIDDSALSASRIDFATKSATTPSARNRKRKEFEEELDDAASNVKRRRSEKSPAIGKTTSARQRKKPEPEPQPGHSTSQFGYLDNQSEDEIHETIEVGVSLDEIQTGESDNSSLQTSESRPSTSDGSDTAAAQVQPATPQPQVVPQVEQAVAFVSENEDVSQKDLMARQSDEAEIALKDITHPQPDQPKHHDGIRNTTSDPTIPTAVDQVFDKSSLEAHHVQDAHLQSSNLEKSEQMPAPKVENQTTEASIIPKPDLVAEISEKSEPKDKEAVATPHSPKPDQELDSSLSTTIPPSATSSPPPADPLPSTDPLDVEMSKSPEPVTSFKPSQPTPDISLLGSSESSQLETTPQLPRLEKLDAIFKQPTPFGTELNLTPYEDEEVRLPAPYLEKTKPVESSIPTPTPTPSPVESCVSEISWDFSRPLTQREFFKLYRQEMKKREVTGEQRMTMIEFNNYCARQYKAAQSANGHSIEQPISSESTKKASRSTATSQVRKRPALVATASFDETPRGSQAADSRQPTAAPSPAPIDEGAGTGQTESGDIEQETEDVLEEVAELNGAVEPAEKVQTPRKQYSFPKIRDPSEFIAALESYQDMGQEELFKVVAATVEALHAWEKEYYELRKIVDDEDNAKRRLPNDKAIENWEKRQRPDEPEHFRRHFDESYKGPPPFELKGVRVPKPYVDDPVLERQKDNDRIMAQAYGFKYSSHPAQVGRQNPEEQRWEMTERGLRDRKKTEKGAELAEENVIEGKRARKPRNLSDQSKDPSRSGTPTSTNALGLGRRVRRKPGAIQEDEPKVEPKASKPAVDEGVLAPVARKRRGPRPRAQMEQEESNPTPTVDNNQTEDERVEGKQTAVHKRALPLTSAPVETEESKRQRPPKGQPSAEIASSSFYSNPSPANTQPESRPSTASSEATVHTGETGESAYSLRDKRKRNFVLENDPVLESRVQKKARIGTLPSNKQETVEPKKRAARKKNIPTSAPAEPAQIPPPPPTIAPQPVGGLKAPVLFFNNAPPVLAPAPGPFMHTFNATPPVFPPTGAPPQPAEPAAAKKPIVRIKITNNGPGSQGPSRTPTPANIAPNPAPKSVKISRSVKPGTPSDVAPPQQLGPTNPISSDVPEKPYAEMSKSEKMSYSMRRRWASGEMKGAVEKRRTTLANKKAEKAASGPNSADPSVAGRTPDPGSAGPSAPTTPALIPTQSGSLAFPPPAQNLPPLQPLQQQPLHQQPLQQPVQHPTGMQQPLQQPMHQPMMHHHQPLQPIQHLQQPMQPMQPMQSMQSMQPLQPLQPLQHTLQQPAHMLHQQALPYSYQVQTRPGPLSDLR